MPNLPKRLEIYHGSLIFGLGDTSTTLFIVYRSNQSVSYLWNRKLTFLFHNKSINKISELFIM